ncbi:type II and III secretion system protein family protein [Enhydrobacter sp.]|jgi:pilus assembly protein CpaC|uniref:type II and III secretion system protein family protein n=1 Tax=Enhydrobacter sp. TaxID=1894999 RepID=UPI0026170B62|nr:type II and III secretion system protein family protein [Enhydrobacter sp.]WIM13232.1 MAG: Type II/IV secretion system secretin RcpA/CpaC, associated with Flp pilus assembly [Enhydrobacter sp.]
MITIPSVAPASPRWRHVGASLALAASFAFVLQPAIALAQSPDSESASQSHATKPKPHTKQAAKKASRHAANDFVSDDLNRREAERAALVVRELTGEAAPAAGPSGSSKAAAKPTHASVPAVATAEKPQRTAKKTSRHAPNDFVSDDLNRREAERAQRVVHELTEAAVPAAATPTVMAQATSGATDQPEIMHGGPSASVAQAPAHTTERPDVLRGAPADTARTPLATDAKSESPPLPSTAQPVPQLAQAPAPAPVPIQPPSGTTTPTTPPAVVGGAPGRAFGQSQVVPPQQPTLRLEVNKGTAVKLPGPASTVFVAAPDIADVQVKSPGMIYVFAKKPGDTVLYAVDSQDRVLLNTIVSVTSPLSRIKGALDSIHPHNGVTFDNQGETIVLGGTVRSAQVAEDARRLALQQVNGNASKVISNIQVDAPTQVQLQVKVAEVNRDSLKRVGINWQNISNVALFGTGWASAGFAINTIQNTGGAASGLIRLQTNGGLTSLIDFLATQGQATILAEPNLIAMSGENASFLAGGEIPVIAPQGGITNTIAVTYKQVGISLNFTPTIIGDRINLKVAPEVSQVTTTGQVSVPISPTASIIVPAIQTRRASTTVELGSGQSFAIAGLMQRTTKQDIQKMPWLGDIPVLGALFKSDAYQRNETELVIIVTPYFVQPTNDQLRTPLTARVPPTDADRIIYGRFNNPTPPQRLTVGQQSAGPTAGFKLN